MYKRFLSFILLTLMAIQSVNATADVYHSEDESSFFSTSLHDPIKNSAISPSDLLEQAYNQTPGSCDNHDVCHSNCSLQLHYLPDSCLAISEARIAGLLNNNSRNLWVDSQSSSLFRPPRT
ncbi:MAG: hypothetical protein ISEC1_P0245 [Thiomicrorhabdus sp.]|nr:MAG: hypothetical protein ISEC1_P0245 [Thiomicrorhabdus sp.]